MPPSEVIWMGAAVQVVTLAAVVFSAGRIVERVNNLARRMADVEARLGAACHIHDCPLAAGERRHGR